MESREVRDAAVANDVEREVLEKAKSYVDRTTYDVYQQVSKAIDNAQLLETGALDIDFSFLRQVVLDAFMMGSATAFRISAEVYDNAFLEESKNP